jgi:hypothetical protein
MNIIEKIMKHLSYESRVENFLKDSRNMINYYTSLMPNNVIGKHAMLSNLHLIELDLAFLAAYKNEYKRTKDENHKKLIRQIVREIRKKEKNVLNILDQNRNFFIHIYSLQTIKTK